MLPSSHSQCYEEFKRFVGEVKDTTSKDTVDRAVLKSSVANLQHYFQNQILTLNTAGLEASLEQQVHSFQVEMDKQLKLLALDGLFLQAARQPTTTVHRLKQMNDRLTLLQQYCDGLLRNY